MRVTVNGIRLFFDVEGARHVPNARAMRTKPTLLLLHGGPGHDHSYYKPAYSAFADIAQVIYLDHRGNGRSEYGPKELWNLAQWGDDVRGFCEALEIEKPIVLGVSFGGMVAMSYATRHLDYPGKLVLVSTDARGGSHAQAKVEMFGKLGGADAGALAHRRFNDLDASPEVLVKWMEIAYPLYTQSGLDVEAAERAILHRECTAWFNKPGGESRTFNFLPELARIQCPTLLIGGKLDPMIPIECQRDIAAAIPAQWLEYHEFENAGHGVMPDAPEEMVKLVRGFIG
jgi:pimeloyl-ACP methyl ester carboxylesterase